jgi:hypothetical protein
MERVFKVITLETGLAVGLVLSLAGLAGSGQAVWAWEQNSFGPLDSPDALRTIIPSLISLVMGVQIIFSSFFISVLGMKRSRQMSRRDSSADSPEVRGGMDGQYADRQLPRSRAQGTGNIQNPMLTDD